MTRHPPNIDAILAEYRAVRDEILQLNGQLFAVLGSSLTLNVAILGWLFTRTDPARFFGLPTVGILMLFVGNSILLNRNRLAHRLALFQKYFIETRLPDICWGPCVLRISKPVSGVRVFTLGGTVGRFGHIRPALSKRR